MRTSIWVTFLNTRPSMIDSIRGSLPIVHIIISPADPTRSHKSDNADDDVHQMIDLLPWMCPFDEIFAFLLVNMFGVDRARYSNLQVTTWIAHSVRAAKSRERVRSPWSMGFRNLFCPTYSNRLTLSPCHRQIWNGKYRSSCLTDSRGIWYVVPQGKSKPRNCRHEDIQVVGQALAPDWEMKLSGRSSCFLICSPLLSKTYVECVFRIMKQVFSSFVVLLPWSFCWMTNSGNIFHHCWKPLIGDYRHVLRFCSLNCRLIKSGFFDDPFFVCRFVNAPDQAFIRAFIKIHVITDVVSICFYLVSTISHYVCAKSIT